MSIDLINIDEDPFLMSWKCPHPILINQLTVFMMVFSLHIKMEMFIIIIIISIVPCKITDF